MHNLHTRNKASAELKKWGDTGDGKARTMKEKICICDSMKDITRIALDGCAEYPVIFFSSPYPLYVTLAGAIWYEPLAFDLEKCIIHKVTRQLYGSEPTRLGETTNPRAHDAKHPARQLAREA